MTQLAMSMSAIFVVYLFLFGHKRFSWNGRGLSMPKMSINTNQQKGNKSTFMSFWECWRCIGGSSQAYGDFPQTLFIWSFSASFVTREKVY